ncbi:MAG: DinB family protein [Chloroflexota bacterium]|nr:DinB family protein [Chloroflexia bacterium]MDQ3227634.1 DinB family protein [Chloroflexota bacterium]
MTTYDLFLESGPRHRKTMVHVLALLGCVAVGPTTAEALAATPDAIRAFRRFLNRLGEDIDTDSPFATRIAEHITKGDFIGNGSPYILFAPDNAPLNDTEIALLLGRIVGIGEALAAWSATRTTAALDESPPNGGRPTREILRHVLAARGSYLAAALGSAPGFGPIASAFERGEISFPEALARSTARIVTILQATTPEQRTTARQLPSGPKTLRQALRRILEHDWEHLAELSRRPGGPLL